MQIQTPNAIIASSKSLPIRSLQKLNDAESLTSSKGSSFSRNTFLNPLFDFTVILRPTVNYFRFQDAKFIDGTTLEIEKIMAANPRRVAEIKIDFNFPKGVKYTDKEKRLIESAARTCPVANSLHPDIIKTVKFNYDEE